VKFNISRVREVSNTYRKQAFREPSVLYIQAKQKGGKWQAVIMVSRLGMTHGIDR